jgi:apolipoprotein D and lipocalin family protein
MGKRFAGWAMVLGGLLSPGCVGIPENIKPVEPFEATRYLGKWYEIARLDHSFERGLTRVTATYGLREGGGLTVVNRGWSAKDGTWKSATGKAFFVQGPRRGYLKVSFFGPFYGSYIVFELDQEGYQHALVAGPDKSYLWLLARTPKMDPAKRQEWVDKAKALGFDTAKLVFVAQDGS